MVTLDEVMEYLGADVVARWAEGTEPDITYPQIQDAYDAEVTAQNRRVKRPPFCPDLDEALKRRVQRNLAMRPLPLAVVQGNADTGASSYRPGSTDPEIRRFEAPYPRIVVG